jgi:hypothetical protein
VVGSKIATSPVGSLGHLSMTIMRDGVPPNVGSNLRSQFDSYGNKSIIFIPSQMPPSDGGGLAGKRMYRVSPIIYGYLPHHNGRMPVQPGSSVVIMVYIYCAIWLH